MDEIVKAAMLKWPHVPQCHGWLGLDEQGQWRLRDEQAQQAGPFAGEGSRTAAKGWVLQHEKWVAFVGRNYQADGQGCWYFQNGPQKVYVELACTPWVVRLDDAGQWSVHTGEITHMQAVWLDEMGRVYIHTTHGLGLLHSRDVPRLATWLEAHPATPLETCVAASLPQRFGYVLSPVAMHGAA